MGTLTDVLAHGASGYRMRTPEKVEATRDTVYDLASLTKVVCTTTLIMMLRDEGKLALDQPVSEIVPVAGFKRFTVRHLLTHTAGLPAFRLWYKEVSTMDEVVERLGEVSPEWTPGTRRRYSDLGFMILGKAVELLEGDSLDAAAHRRIFHHLGMENTTFKPPAEWRTRCAATEQCPWRGKVMQGEVHDEMAYAVGGVSGHAGLFSTTGDLAIFCRALLNGLLVAPETLREMTALGQVPSYPWQGLGWKMDPWMDSSEGFLPSRAAFGHTGWTGTNLWVDRDRGFFTILLSNTCHPSRQARDNRTLRTLVYTAVTQAHYPNQGNTHTGLDRLVWDGFDDVKGKRLGVLTNHAAVDQLNRPLLEVFRLNPAVNVARLFTPEHGFHGQAEAGEAVKTQQAPYPVTSLYGEAKEPSREELKGIDLFVVDLPDIGSRYYTYMATMKHALDACAKSGTPVLVLDRPNPLGGTVLEGAIARQVGAEVCSAPIPARHGMTLGELALFFQRTDKGLKGLRLAVCTADQWPRELTYSQYPLPWVAPSPNMPDAETALLYAGMCLFEGVNLNEGRGTETPFRLIGAPWLNAEAVLAGVPARMSSGCALERVVYTPQAIQGKASHPEYQDRACHGIRLHVTDPGAARPFGLAVALLGAIRKTHPEELEWRPFFDTLAGGAELRQRICQGESAEDLCEAWTGELGDFDRRRPKCYLTRMEYWERLLKG